MQPRGKKIPMTVRSISFAHACVELRRREDDLMSYPLALRNGADILLMPLSSKGRFATLCPPKDRSAQRRR